MKRLLQKAFLMLIFTVYMIACCIPVSVSATGNDTVSLNSTVTPISAGSYFTPNGYQIPNDNYSYYRITVYIDGTADLGGFGNISLFVSFNQSQYQGVTGADGETPLFSRGYALGNFDTGGFLGISTALDNTTGAFAVATLGTENYGTDGEIGSILLKSLTTSAPEPSVTLSLPEINDSYGHPIINSERQTGSHGTEYVLYPHQHQIYYTIGDINGNGICDAADAQNLLILVSQYQSGHSYDQTVSNNSSAYVGMMHTNHMGNPMFIADVGDIDGDSELTNDDVELLLHEYVYHLTHPNSAYAYGIGTQGVYTYTYYSNEP